MQQRCRVILICNIIRDEERLGNRLILDEYSFVNKYQATTSHKRVSYMAPRYEPVN